MEPLRGTYPLTIPAFPNEASRTLVHVGVIHMYGLRPIFIC
ncbi:hypothetical protein [uncultured Muribaculum sp.]|nr:hypothetical protein [uncultured Muribaculum sp.]